MRRFRSRLIADFAAWFYPKKQLADMQEIRDNIGKFCDIKTDQPGVRRIVELNDIYLRAVNANVTEILGLIKWIAGLAAGAFTVITVFGGKEKLSELQTLLSAKGLLSNFKIGVLALSWDMVPCILCLVLFFITRYKVQKLFYLGGMFLYFGKPEYEKYVGRIQGADIRYIVIIRIIFILIALIFMLFLLAFGEFAFVLYRLVT